MSDKKRVFVVHGRNGQVRDSMFSYLRTIGLHPIEWSQAVELSGEASPEISLVLRSAFSVAQAVIVILSGDDLTRVREEFLTEDDPEYERILTPQARPNVLFEAGMAFGTHPQRTVLVQVGAIRPFSDIAGRHIIRLNNSSSRRQELANRLKIAGCEVDLSGTDWHHVGNFDVSGLIPTKNTEKTALSAKEGDRQLLVLTAMESLEEETVSNEGRRVALTAAEIANRAEMRTMTIEDILCDLQKGGFIEYDGGYDGRIDSGFIAYRLAQKGRDILLTKKHED